MLLLSALLLVLTTPVWTRPTPSYTLDPISVLSRDRDIRHPHPRVEMSHIAHLAKAVNGVNCLEENRSIVPRSTQGENTGVDVDEDMDVSYYITYEQSRNTYTLAFSSSAPEDLLELLASVPSENESGSHSAPLPDSFLPLYLHHGAGSIYSPYLPYLATVTEATDALSKILDRHQHRPSYLSSLNLLRSLRSIGSTFGFFPPPTTTTKGLDGDSERGPTVEIVGHGLGAVLALLSSLRQSTVHPDLHIRGTFFSMPILGDSTFAHSVNHLLMARDGRLELQRVTNGRDPLPFLPPPHFGLAHPTSISERYIEGSQGMEASGSGSGSGSGSRLDDSLGPYARVMIGLSC